SWQSATRPRPAWLDSYESWAMRSDFANAPAEWAKRSFGEFCEEVRRPAGSAKYPILSVSKDLGIVLQSEKFKKRIASADTSRYKRVRYGEFAYDPMLLWSGSIARQERVDEGIISPAYYAFRVDHTVDHDFLFQFLKWERMNQIYADISVGTNTRRRKASFDAFCGLTFPLPPLPEQKKIAAILASVDEAIQATEAVIEQTRRVKEGLLQDLLTRGIGHTRFKETEIGEIPESWEAPLLDTVAQRGSGHTPSKKHPEYWNGGIKWVSLADSHALDRVYLSETDKEISAQGIDNSSAVLHPAGTVFVSRDASVGRSAIAACELAVSQHFIAWRCGPKLNNRYLYYFLQSHKSSFERIAVGSTIKTIGLGYFKRLRVPLPPKPEQDAIAEQLFSHDECIDAELRQLEGLQQIKAGLLQDLLTGAVRVAP
ncbi:MAG: restriction endonuclease subunit S, partial [Bacteroidota bacterium]